MPENPGSQRYPHLQLLQKGSSLDRKKRQPNFGSPPKRGTRAAFATQIRGKLQAVEEVIRKKKDTKTQGLQSHLVFRIPTASNVPIETLVDSLEKVGLSIVSFEKDKTVVAFRTEINLQEFYQAIASYENGPRSGINSKTGKPYKSTKWDIFEYIEPVGIRPWGPEDRIGARLRESIGSIGEQVLPTQLYKLDLELWHPGTHQQATAALNEIRKFIQSTGNDQERFLDHFSGESITLARVSVFGTSLTRLLNSDIVAEIELPPAVTFNAASASKVTARDFPAIAPPPENGPRVCILDSGVSSSHPLLDKHVGHQEAIVTATSDSNDQNGHGTRVGSLAVFGNIRACFESGHFASPVTLYSARVLNKDNAFDDEKLIVNQMKTAIEMFMQAPYNCRVFNLSLGSSGSAFTNSLKQPIWAEALDLLARELQVLLVVSAGNNLAALTFKTTESEDVLQHYKDILTHESARLCDPATSAIALTVGALVEHDTPAVHHGAGKDDIRLAVAKRNQPSPFTRSGSGVNGGIKPDFVDYGGNLVFMGTGNSRQIGCEPGTAVMSLAMEFRESLFAYDFGTSYAAPLLARKAALLWTELEKQEISVTPNLVRALLASAAIIPSEADELFEGEPHHVVRLYGNGVVDLERAGHSSDQHVTMIANTAIEIDKFLVFEIPVPEEFRNAPGKKEIAVCLAFDPPVRARRLDYLGIEMNFDLIRGKSANEVVDAYKKVEAGADPLSIKGANKVKFTPTMQPKGGHYNRKKGTLQKGTFQFSRENSSYGDSYWLVLRCERKWARESDVSQNFSVAVTMKAEEPQLYNLIQQRVRVRAKQRG